METKTAINLARVVLVVSFLITLYFLLPYITTLLGIRSFVITTNSMYHTGENQAFFEDFWENRGVNPEGMHLRYGFGSGDLLVIAPSESYRVGDVAVLGLAETFIAHRIYEYNTTHFRDIGDNVINENNTGIVTLGVSGLDVFEIREGEESFKRPEKTYKGPRFERSSHYWMPVSYIEGKVSAVLPGAGLLYMILENPNYVETV